MNSPGSGKKRKAAADRGTFVWAREGDHDTAKEHAAYLLQSCDVPRSEGNEDDYVYVRWASTGTIQCIPKSNISSTEEDDLSHRRRRKRSATTTNDNTDSTATTTKQTTSQSRRDNNRRKSKLSLTKKQRQHWRDYHHNLQCTKQVERGQNNVSKDESKMTTQHDNLDDMKMKSSHVDSINDVDDDNDISDEEKKEDDIEINMQSSKTKSPVYDRIQKMKEGNSIIEKLQQHPKTTSYIEERQVPTETKIQQPQQQDHSAEEMMGDKTETAERKQLYTPRSSAYVQHLSEACNVIMSDGRWRTIKRNETALSSKETTIFSWEEGDDLSAVKAFMSLYEEDNANDEMEEETLNKIEDDNTIVFERSMNLYSRIYHRKGPWFDISDLYVRYYAPQLSETTDEETKRTHCSMSNQQAALQRLFTDIVRLESMGLLRTFESEYECGTVAGKMSTSKRGVLLSAEERNQVLRLLGGGKSPKAAKVVSMPNQSNNCTNEILAQMQSQKTLLSAFSATTCKSTTTTSLLPVRKHVNKVLLRKLAMKMIMLSKTKDDQVRAPKREEVEMTQQMIETAWKNVTKDYAELTKSNVLSTIRLREAPLQTLRRVMRLFLCAGGGPGSMRGDGTNGWRTCYETSDSWHKVEYPGLNFRLGLQSYPLQKYFVNIHDHNASTGVFDSFGEFRLFEIGAELRSSIDTLIEGYERDKMARRRKEKDQAHSDENQTTRDVFQLLTRKGRQNLVKWVLSCISPTNEAALLKICTKIEDDLRHINEFCGSIGGNESVILHTSIVCRRILQYRLDNSTVLLSARPWLRHLSFDAILTYIVWDGIPFLEKRDLYVMASSTLTTILFGTSVQNFSFDCLGGMLQSNQSGSNPLIRYLLPRRNRGKAMERLLIDLTHAYRKEKKEKSNNSTPLDLSPIQERCRSLLGDAAISCSIPFSSIRNLARRLKAPLIRTMDGIPNAEMRTLQIRLDNVNSDSDDLASCTSYRDWSAKTDLSIANALSNDRNESAAGKRCAFVGWESFDGDNYSENTRSLNVEELALEEYNAGRLPNADDETNMWRGNWEGWHDEGGHARKLFRIIFLQLVLEECTDATTFLTPYQQSPHDLHVGYQKVESGERKEVSSIPGFYERRYDSIETFLSKLSRQTDQELSDLVHECIKTRWDSHANDESRVKDLPLMKDVIETRTLSMIAAGIGGKALAAMFRAFAFDYRHYSGGLPDLLLTRARHLSSADSAENHFVDLGEWVGEAFCKDHIEEEKMNRSIGMLADRDDDFLGCSKQADAISSRSKFSSLKRRQKISVLPEFPDKLQLIHNHTPVKVECMFVEVKSSNDRLDSRQEDWLNIIDRFGSARVCKFGSKKQSK